MTDPEHRLLSPCLRIEFPTAPRARVRGGRHARGAVENSCADAMLAEYLTSD